MAEMPRRVREQAASRSSPGRWALPKSVHSVLDRAGAPLRADDRVAMQARFGHDFANVRIHADAPAAASADDLRADAYTFGSRIVFGSGVYRPGDPSGRSVLAHELTHVLQQR